MGPTLDGVGNRGVSLAIARHERELVDDSADPAALASLPPEHETVACPPDQEALIAVDVLHAIELVGRALHEATSPPDSPEGIRFRQTQVAELHSDHDAVTDQLVLVLRHILFDLERALEGLEWRCGLVWSDLAGRAPLGELSDDGFTSEPATGPVDLFPRYFTLPAHERAVTWAHESAHRAGVEGDEYAWMPSYPYLPANAAVRNADSVAYFVLGLAQLASPPDAS